MCSLSVYYTYTYISVHSAYYSACKCTPRESTIRRSAAQTAVSENRVRAPGFSSSALFCLCDPEGSMFYMKVTSICSNVAHGWLLYL
jgi:hypothetical protein